MSEDAAFIANYKPNHLYIHPGAKGAYAAIAGESETVIGEIDVTQRSKLAVSAFFVKDSRDFGTLKLTKLNWHARWGWQEDSQLHINKFQLAQIQQFLEIIASLDLTDAGKARVSLGDLQLGALGSLLSDPKGAELLNALSKSPELPRDIYAVAAKRAALAEFGAMLDVGGTDEGSWQAFFERNPWIFGHGLNYVFLSKLGEKLETVTTGNSFDQKGKRIDALMLTKAEVSQYVLVEIKRADTPLLRRSSHRPGCWAVSDAVSDAVTQAQKTVFEFARHRFRDAIKTPDGMNTGEDVYSVAPRSYLVIGNLAQLTDHDDKIACFELYRRNTRAPEILTFDELFHRAQFIVETISKESATLP